MITLCAWGNGIPWAPSPAAPLAGTDRSSRGASPHALSSCHLRSGVNGAETRRPHNPHRAQRPLRARSTKAGAETPATHFRVWRHVSWRTCAQRRPGPRPRRHAHERFFQVRHDLRSTKAGAETPATPLISPSGGFVLSPLNEGRGRDPGDTGRGCTAHGVGYPAQRRPGPRPRRHLKFRNLFRGKWFAQRRPGPRPRRHVHRLERDLRRRRRSTKAGAETPATPGDRTHTRVRLPPLNEGRGRDPGDTGPFASVLLDEISAQRRPGPRPRRHHRHPTYPSSDPHAQRRPGPRPRRHISLAPNWNARSFAQRRPGPRPRRHPLTSPPKATGS